ncbi:MAG: hypothetical protein JO261_11495 [Alphaproteobacteria bacterium]|nr:hypothetical protein [Alphaproteobacteria bacterium]
MIHMTLIMEDTVLVATRDLPNSEGQWSILAQDSHAGIGHASLLSDAELTAIVSLALANDEDQEGLDRKKLYEVAEEVLKTWPPEVRPIP